MIVKNPTVDELLNNYPNLHEAVNILIQGLKEGQNASTLLYYWDEFRKQDKLEKGAR